MEFHDLSDNTEFCFDSDTFLFQIACYVFRGTPAKVPGVMSRWSKMPKAELGLKRCCLSCGMKFYDFNRTPIICPGCSAEFDPESLVRSRRGRAAAKPAAKTAKTAAEAETIEAEADTDVEETDEADAAVDTGTSETGDAEGDDFDESDIDVSNDDSAGLIADDLDEDDEIIPGISTSNDD